MKVIMTGGGTGGHIYPAIAIADKIKRKHQDAEILFIGTERGMEKDIVPANGYPIKFINVMGLNRKNLLKNVKTMVSLLQSDAECKKIIKEFKPDVVIGTGGYVCGPVVRAAYKKGIKTFIHEQNALPGVTNKLLEKYSSKVFVSFPDAVQHFKNKEKVYVTGNPVRKNFLLSKITDFRKKYNIDETNFAILCFGGSLGANAINEVMMETLKLLKDVSDIQVFFVTGKHYYDSILENVKTLAMKNVIIMPYTENMHEYMMASDLIISRSGALTVSEITACGKASILVPSPNVTGNHQLYNAKVVADRGGAILFEEKEFTAEKLFNNIMKLKNNKELLNKMSEASEKVGRLDATDVIYQLLSLD